MTEPHIGINEKTRSLITDSRQRSAEAVGGWRLSGVLSSRLLTVMNEEARVGGRLILGRRLYALRGSAKLNEISGLPN